MNREEQYKMLVSAWSSGVGSYHSLFSAYLTANSIFLAASVLLAKSFIENQSSVSFAIISASVSMLGVFVSFQMAVALTRFSGEKGYFEWELRGIEAQRDFEGIELFNNLHRWRENRERVQNSGNEPSTYPPNWAVKIHRFKFAARSKLMPFVFGVVQLVVLTTVVTAYFL